MGIFDELKSVAKTLREADKIPQYEQILGVQEKLLEMQNKIADLEREKKELSEKLETKESLKYENNAYWAVRGDKHDGPYCSRCWDVERNTVRLKPSGNPAFHSCPECKNSVQTNSGYNSPYRPMSPPLSYI